MTNTIKSNNKICLRQGYNCQCEFCLPWIARWESEVSGFVVLNAMLEEGRPLIHIFERLRSEYPELLMTHDEYIVDEYYKRIHNSVHAKKKRKILDDSSASTASG